MLLWWLLGNPRLAPRHASILANLSAEKPAVVSVISLWEIAMLVRMGRVELDLPLREWLERAVAPPLVRQFGITPALAAATADFSEDFPRDPGDRLIAATARVLGGTLLTVDRKIIASGEVAVI